MAHKKIVIIGPGHPLRGGIATFNQRLCQQFTDEGHTCSIYSFSLQYPSFLFPGTTQYSSEPRATGYGNIFGHQFSASAQLDTSGQYHPASVKPDIVLVRYWLPFMGPALGTILRPHKEE